MDFKFGRHVPRDSLDITPYSLDVKCRRETLFFGVNLALESLQSFLQFLYLWRVLIKNSDDAILAPLGILTNMQIKEAITGIPFFWP